MLELNPKGFSLLKKGDFFLKKFEINTHLSSSKQTMLLLKESLKLQTHCTHKHYRFSQKNCEELFFSYFFFQQKLCTYLIVGILEDLMNP